MKRHVYVRGEKIPVEARKLRGHDGLAYKRTKSDKRACRRRIVIRKNIKGKNRLSTVVHEMLHQLDIGLSESTILRLEEGIIEMVEDNPEVFSRLSGLLEKS